MTIKVFTFNLRVSSEGDGINNLPNRKDRILDCIREYEPDIIGFQEARDSTRLWLSESLAAMGYTLVGCGRNGDYRGESTPAAFKRDKFEMISAETKWLSMTPTVPGTTFGGDQSSCPRIMTSLVLSPCDGSPFLFVNTHLDHKGGNARVHGAVEVLQYISEKNLPFILTGDMNAKPDSPAIAAFTEAKPCGRYVSDTTSLIPGTFHGFGKYSVMGKIDYIFTDLKCDITRSFAIPDEPADGIYISDHRPVCAFVENDGF